MKRKGLSRLNIVGLAVAVAIAAPLLSGCVPGELRAATPREEASPVMNEELAAFIDAVYKEPYSYFFNNCINKSLRIKAVADRLEMKADLIGGIAIVPFKRWHNFPIVSPHVYTEIEGEKVDVALDPAREEIYCKNSEVRILMPVNISEIGRAFLWKTGLGGYLLREGCGRS